MRHGSAFAAPATCASARSACAGRAAGVAARSHTHAHTSLRTRGRGHARRGTVLFAVLVIGMAAILVVAGLLAAMEAEVTGRTAVRRDAALRTMASSAFAVVGDLLDEQRGRVLNGEAAQAPPARIELWEEGGRVGLLRLLPVGPGGEVMVSENGKLDLNTVDAAALVATGMVDEEMAERIVQERTRRGGFASVHSLLEVTGVTPQLLEGDEPPEDFAMQASGEEDDLRSRVLERLGGAEPRGLLDVVSVHVAEPSLQRSGVRRIDLNRSWSPELGTRLDERFGEGTGEVMRGIMAQQQFPDDRTIVSVLRRFSVGEDEWPPILDALTGRIGDEVTGRTDMHTAPAAVLVGLGMTPEQAEGIVAARGSLSNDERWTVTWPLARGILDGSALEELIDRLTVRSWCYRVRIAVLEVDAEDDTIVHAGPLVFDVIYDLVDPVVRVAALRDITQLPLARVLADVMPDEFDVDGLPFEDDDQVGEALFSPLPDEDGLPPLPEFGSDDRLRGGFSEMPDPFGRRVDPPAAEVNPSGAQPGAGSEAPSSRRRGRWRAG